MAGQDETMDILVESYNDNVRRTFGGIVVNGCMFMNDQYGYNGYEMTNTWTLFGDPTLMVRTKAPETFTASYSPIIVVGESSLQINSSADDLTVTLSKNNEIVATGRTYNGTEILNFSPVIDTSAFILTITGYNYKTVIDTIEVVENNFSYVVLADFIINDDNQQFDYAETVSINTVFRNVGLVSAQNVYAKLIAYSDYITLLNDSVFIGNIDAKTAVSIPDAFEIIVADNAQNEIPAYFNIIITDGNNISRETWFQKNVNAPEFKLIRASINDNLAGNGNSRLDPGEFAMLDLSFVNSGKSKSKSIQLEILPVQNLTIVEGNYTFEPLDSFDTILVSIPVYTNSFANIGDEICVRINLEADQHFLNDTLFFPFGKISEGFESGNFSKFAWDTILPASWFIYDTSIYNTSADTIYPFEGSFCAHSAEIPHGQKSELKLSLNVNANDEISFFLRVSCENGGILYFDFLEFLIDGQSQQKWQGEVPWTQASFPVEKGEHTFTWRYRKDASLSVGEDAAFIDKIILPSHQTNLTPELQFAFVSEPVTLVKENEMYEYVIDFNSFSIDFIEEEVELIGYEIPSWLNLTKNNNDEWVLSGNANVAQGTTEQVYLFARFNNVFAHQVFELKVEPPVTISESGHKEFGVYPNPFYDEIMIEGFSFESVQVFDFFGHEISGEIIGNKVKLNVKSGIYFFKIFDGKQYYSFKLVKSD